LNGILIFLSKSPIDAKDKVGNACHERPFRFHVCFLNNPSFWARKRHRENIILKQNIETDIQVAVAVFAEIGILSTYVTQL
jgi:hypothetical protein